MDIVPAIDLIQGKCVRLTRGEYGRKKIYSIKPVAAAKEFKRQGAKRLQVIDLDGARSGRPKNLRTAARIKRATGLVVVFGGGMRSPDSIVRAFRAGMDCVILGTAAYTNPLMLKQALGKYGRRIMVAVEGRRGKVAISGWKNTLESTPADAIRRLGAMGVKNILFTDTERDGTLLGVDLVSMRRILAVGRRAGISVYYAGGIRDVNDIRTLCRLDRRVLRGIVAGKSLYEGTLSIGAAIREARR